MLSERYFHHFDAVLKLPDGKKLATGKASIDIVKKSVIFTSSFVPLYPMGSKIEIVRLFGGREIHRFIGTVYLSDKNLLSIVSVTDLLLPGSEHCYCGDLNFSAKATFVDSEQVLKRKKKNDAESTEHDVNITELNFEKLFFQLPFEDDFYEDDPKSFPSLIKTLRSVSGKNFSEQGLEFELKFSSPLPEIPVNIRIIEPFYFGNRCGYSCNIIKIGTVDKYNLGKFLWTNNLLNNKVFTVSTININS